MFQATSSKSVICSVALVVAATVTQRGHAQRCLEVSPDGREAVVDRCLTSEVPTAGGVAKAIGGAPYGAAPNWQNTLRRQVSSLLTADIDGDGDLDLVVGCYTSQSFPPYDDWHNMIYRNVGGQLQANPSWISTDQVHTGDLAVADFNRDGFVDVFSANGGSSMSPSVIYFGGPGGPSTSPGWFSSVPGSTWATSCIAFDFDHDGDIDIVTTNQSPIQSNPYRPIFMFRNINGSVEVSPSWQSAEASIQNGLDVADVDGDGWEDLGVAKWVNFESAIYKNINGTLQTGPAWTCGTTGTDKGAAFADVNHDGRIDIAIGGNSSTNQTRLYTQNNDGTFNITWSTTTSAPSVQELRFADVNGDGWDDLTEIHFSSGRCHIYLNNKGVLDNAPTWFYDPVPVGTAVTFGDINGDGCPDLIIGYSGEPSVVVFYNNCPPPPCPADIDGNGHVNIDDLFSVIVQWGPCAGCPADIDGNDYVNIDDLFAVIGSWGPCP
jgi:hypothetical protein